MGDIDVMQGHLPGLQDQVLGLRLVVFMALKLLVQRHVGAVIPSMIHQPVLLVRAGDVAQTAVLFRRRVDGDPDRTGRQRTDRPVLAVLMPGGFLAVQRRLGEKAHVPEADIRPDHLLDHVEDLRVAGIVQEPEIIVQKDRGIVAELRMALQQCGVTGADLLELGLRQPVIGHDVTLVVICGDLGVGQHGRLLLRADAIAGGGRRGRAFSGKPRRHGTALPRHPPGQQ